MIRNYSYACENNFVLAGVSSHSLLDWKLVFPMNHVKTCNSFLQGVQLHPRLTCEVRKPQQFLTRTCHLLWSSDLLLNRHIQILSSFFSFVPTAAIADLIWVISCLNYHNLLLPVLFSSVLNIPSIFFTYLVNKSLLYFPSIRFWDNDSQFLEILNSSTCKIFFSFLLFKY